MAIDWHAKPVPYNARTKRDGIASVAEVKGGWEWKAWYRDRMGKGVKPTRADAMQAASDWIDIQVAANQLDG
jgi:hypothetical protein